MTPFTWTPPADPNGLCDNRTLTEAVQALHAFIVANGVGIAPQTVHAQATVSGQPVDVAVTIGPETANG